MKSKLYCKILAVGIICLFVGVSVVSSAGCVNIYENDKDIKSSDDEVEIISIIRGYARCYTEFSRDFITRDIGIGGSICDINVFAITSFKPFRYYRDNVDKELRIPCFIGRCYSPNMDYVEISGIAIGNIDIEG